MDLGRKDQEMDRSVEADEENLGVIITCYRWEKGMRNESIHKNCNFSFNKS